MFFQICIWGKISQKKKQEQYSISGRGKTVSRGVNVITRKIQKLDLTIRKKGCVRVSVSL